MAITFPENSNLYDNNIFKIAQITPSDRGRLHQCVGLFINRAGLGGTSDANGDVTICYLDGTEETFNFAVSSTSDASADLANTKTQQYLNKVLPMWIKRIPETDTGTGTDTTSAIFIGNHLYGAFLDKETLVPNSAPYLSDDYEFSVDRRASNGTAVGTIAYTDDDDDGITAVLGLPTGLTTAAQNPFSLASNGEITYTRKTTGAESEAGTNLLVPITLTDDYTADPKSRTQNIIVVINPADTPNITSVDVNDVTTTLGNSGATASFTYAGFIDEAVFDAFVLVDRTTVVRVNNNLVAGGSYTLALPDAPAVENYMIQTGTTTVPIVSTAEDGVSSSSYTMTFNKWSPGESPLPLSGNSYDGIEIAGYTELTIPTWDPLQLRYVLDPINSQERRDSFNVRTQRRNARQIARITTAASNAIGGPLVQQTVFFNSSMTIYRYGDLRTDDDEYALDHLIIETAEGSTSAPSDFTGTPDGRSMYEFLIRSRDPETVQRVRLATSTDFAADSFYDGSTFDPDTRAYTGIEYPNGITEIHVEVRRAPRREQVIVANIGTLGTSDTAISTGGGNTKTGTLTVSGTHTLSIRATAGGRARDADGTTAATGNQGDYTFAISEATP